MRKIFSLALVAALFQLGSVSAQTPGAGAQAYPAKQVRFIVPFGAGGGVDIFSRTLAQRMREQSGYTIVVENIPGADGNIGADLVAKLRPVSTISTGPHVLVVSAKLPVKNIPELIDYARANPGKVSFASAGTGGTAHLGMEMFKALSKTDVIHVPYKGSAGAVNDLISGEVSAMFSSLPSLQGLADKGLVKVLAATAPSKSAATKSLPLISTSLPGFDYTTWYAMYAPLATPKPIVDSINAALTKALKNTAMAAKIEAAGTELQPGSPEEVMAWTQRDTDKWARVIRDAKISVE